MALDILVGVRGGFIMRYLAAGESFGKELAAKIEGFLFNTAIVIDRVNRSGYQQGEKREFENDGNYIASGMSMELLHIFSVKKMSRTINIGNIKDGNYFRETNNASRITNDMSVSIFEILNAFLEKFSGDSIENIKNSCDIYMSRIVRR